MKSVIAIVGRPNVGKSTLFNYLTGSRSALVADEPGVTRDRQYGIGNWQGHPFLLIDTGGLEEASTTDRITDVIGLQSLAAAQEADAVIWMVDGREGLTVTDQNLARTLRSNCKRIFLAVNKCEGLDENLALAEFHALGFEHLQAISAKRGSGIPGLMDGLLSELPAKPETTEQARGLRIAVLGRPNVGKSTLVNRMLGEDRMITFDQPGTTRDSISIPFERDGTPYTLIDTAGIRRRARINGHVEKISVIKSLQAIDETEIIILVVDAQDSITEQDASLLGLVVDSGKALIIAVNKWDGLTPEERTRTKSMLDRKLGFIDYACVHYISALHGSGVGNLFGTIDRIGKCIKAEPATPLLNRILQDCIEQHLPPLVHGRRIKLRYVHLGGHNPLRVIIHGNQTDHVPEAYRRYLANSFRKALKLVGTPVFIEFRQGDNPYQGRKNPRSKRQQQKRKRLLRQVKRG